MSVTGSITYLPPQSTRPDRTPSFISFNQDFALLKPGRPELLRGPRRVIRLCMFAVVLPAVLITIPLYVRLVIYPPAHYPMMPTDQRLLARHVSTFWCQAQTTHMNGNFNGYLAKDTPSLDPKRRTHIMLNQLTLKDDVKEYWGFYFQKGSTITISSCARWDGGQLMIVRGVKNLHNCAWIGEKDSAEDMAEDDDLASHERHRLKPEHMAVSDPHGHQETARHADTTDDASLVRPSLYSEERHFTIIKLLQKAIRISKDKKEILRIIQSEHKYQKFASQNQLPEKELMVKNNTNKSTVFVPVLHLDGEVEERDNQTTNFPEILEPVVKSGHARTLPDQLTRNSRKLNGKILRGMRRSLNDKRKKKMNPHDNFTAELFTRDEKRSRSRLKRFIEDDKDYVNGTTEQMEAQKNVHVVDGAESNGKQPSLSVERAIGGHIFPEGLKYEQGTLNQTTIGDNSREEHKSSYSSSEEALASCDGVILTMPLVSHKGCDHNTTQMNKIIYDIPITGTYYFVFSSDNEIFVNDLFFNMTMERVVYNVEESDEVCVNTTDCCMPLKFWSNEQVVVEVPQEGGWQRSYVLDTQCQPRVYLYLSFLLLVPLLIMCCAFP